MGRQRVGHRRQRGVLLGAGGQRQHASRRPGSGRRPRSPAAGCSPVQRKSRYATPSRASASRRKAVTSRTTAGSLRIRRWPRPSVVTSAGIRDRLDEPGGVGPRRLPVAAVVDDERRHRRRRTTPGSRRRTRPSGSRRTRPGDGRTRAGSGLRSRAPAGTGRRAARPRPSAPRSTRRRGGEPPEPQRQVRRDGAERVRDDGLGRAELREHRVQGLAELDPVRASAAGRSVVGVAVRRRVEHHDAEARRPAAGRRTTRAASPGRPSRAPGTTDRARRPRRARGPRRRATRPRTAGHLPGAACAASRGGDREPDVARDPAGEVRSQEIGGRGSSARRAWFWKRTIVLFCGRDMRTP